MIASPDPETEPQTWTDRTDVIALRAAATIAAGERAATSDAPRCSERGTCLRGGRRREPVLGGDHVRGMHTMLELLALAPVADMDTGKLRWPAGTDDASLEEYIHANALGYFHPSSTCAMGTVLDGELRVLGVDGVRVADASAMPTTMRGNPNAACMMMGEKAADMIAAEHGLAAAAASQARATL